MFSLEYVGLMFLISILSGAIVWWVLSSIKKWSDSAVFIAAGFALGAIFLTMSVSNGFRLDNSNYIFLGSLAYLTTYTIFYMQFRTDFPKLKIGFLQYVVFMVKNAEVVMKDTSVEDTLKNIVREEFYSEQMKKVTKNWYEDKSEKDAFGGTLALIMNYMFFVGGIVFVASQSSFIDLFYAILFSDEMKLAFFGVVIIIVGIVVMAYIMSKK